MSKTYRQKHKILTIRILLIQTTQKGLYLARKFDVIYPPQKSLEALHYILNNYLSSEFEEHPIHLFFRIYEKGSNQYIMKPSPSHPYEEQKVNQMWSKYDAAKQETFWGNYEKLIGQSKLSQLNNTSFKAKPLETIKPQIFERSTGAYLINFILVFLVPVVGIVVPSEVGNAVLTTTVSILCLIISIAAARSFNNFGVDNNYLYIHKPFCFARTPFKWSEINAVIIQKMKSEEQVNFFIKLKTKSNEHEFNYGLNGKMHKKFVNILKKKVPNTTFEKITY